MTNAVQIDYVKFARLAGYTEGSARTTFGTLRRKIKSLGDANGGNGSATDKTPSTPATPASGGKKRGRKADGKEVDEGASPGKKARKGGRKPAAAQMADVEVDDDDEDVKGLVKAENDDEDDVVVIQDHDDEAEDGGEDGFFDVEEAII